MVQIGSNPHVIYLLQPHVGFTDQEWDDAIQEQLEFEYFMEKLEEEWKASQPNTSEREAIFEASGISKEQMLMMKQRYILETYEDLARKDGRTEAENKKMKDLRNEYRYRFEAKGISPEDITRAKQFPITNLIKVTRGFACCPFHNEKSPSFAVYKNNTFHCFGCQVNGDSIDLVKHLQKLDFKQAVKYLVGK